MNLVLIDKVLMKLKRCFKSFSPVTSLKRCTYRYYISHVGQLNSFLSEMDMQGTESHNHEFALLSDNFKKNIFDVLGSGPVDVTHTALMVNKAEWFDKNITRSNIKRSQYIYGLLDETYKPVDWQIDFKSGYRWNIKKSYLKQPIGHLPGVDIKIPWELARMHHLVTVALHYAVTDDNNALQYFKNHVLDFIATNPPSYGVNWVCTMDVAIRAANWLIARDILISSGGEFDPEFNAIFIDSLLDHAQHIVRNFERHVISKKNSNHYLANIVGLFFITAYLPETDFSKKWLRFSYEEFIKEVGIQFNKEGTNREGSTAYHCLSTQMVIFAAGLIASLDKMHTDNFEMPNKLKECITRMLTFINIMTKPDGRLVQIGDNDSGRFLKLHPNNYYENTSLDYSDITSSGLAFLQGADATLVSILINTLLDCEAPLPFCAEQLPINTGNTSSASSHFLVSSHTVPITNLTIKSLQSFSYPEFGVIGFKSDDTLLSLRIPPTHQYPVSGHYHNDIFSIEFFESGVSITADPGSYCYTPWPKIRNKYRSAEAHYGSYLLRLFNSKRANLLFYHPLQYKLLSYELTNESITSQIEIKGTIFTRKIRLMSEGILIQDYCNRERFCHQDVNYLNPFAYPNPVAFSSGYGRCERS